ncbi:Putative adenylate kinase [uncultured archaeon]|nr:Putative adenylate kinase [uncultured archaeon]
MRLAITGTPGCGKTTLAKQLGAKLGLKVINEKDFALKNKLGSFNEENELEIPIKEFEKKANSFLKKTDNVLFEGHVLCEAKLVVDKIIVLTINPEELELRLEQRNYHAAKIMDNVFCEGIEYCKKHAQRNYSKEKLVIISSLSSPKLTFAQTLAKLGE